MFSKKNRFSFKNKLPKQTLNSKSFNIRYDKNEEGLKVAVVVSKKVDKRAVVRNRIERLILEIVRKNLPLDTKLSIVFYAKRQANESQELAQEVKNVLEQIGEKPSPPTRLEEPE